VLERYRERGIRILRTDQEGAVRFRLGNDGERVSTCLRGRLE
jgi:beta-lactamase superfamily II metal-dependent hydrolase